MSSALSVVLSHIETVKQMHVFKVKPPKPLNRWTVSHDPELEGSTALERSHGAARFVQIGADKEPDVSWPRGNMAGALRC